MPSGSKKRKNAKKKKGKDGGSNPTIAHHSPTNSQHGNAGKDDHPISHDEKESDYSDVHSPTSQSLTDDQRTTDSPRSDFQKAMEGSENGVNVQKTETSVEGREVVLPSVETSASENNDVNIEFVKRSVEHSSMSDDSSSGSSSDEGSISVDNPSRREVQKPLLSDLPTSDEKPLCPDLPSSHEKPLDSAVATLDEELPTSDVLVPKEQVVSVSEEVTTVVEAAPVESSGVSGGVEALVKENEEKLTGSVPAESSESQKPGDGGELPKEATKPESIEKEIVVNRLPVQRTSWMCCCGLFDLVTGSNR